MSKEIDFDKLFNDIADGASIRTASKNQGIVPGTVYYRINNDKELLERYTRACDERTQNLAESIYEDMDETKTKKMDANVARVVIDTKKWLLSKLNPKKYGDRVEQIVSGSLNVLPEIKIKDEKTGDSKKVEFDVGG